MEILAQLGIDPAVMLAQAVNFFFLLAILTFLVYKPVLKLLDERKNRIADAEKNAKLIDEKLAKTEAMTQAEMQKAQAAASKIMLAAQENAKAQEEKMVNAAKEKVGKIVEEGRSVIAKERDEAAKKIQGEVSKIVILATEKLLSREVKEKDQDKFVAEALKEIASLK
ncbi:MAG: F0F1 ATP synthase subunit B [Candidatus Gracilibacteria bacterium]|jgi:F-type H+-transporting ATPase subunit b